MSAMALCEPEEEAAQTIPLCRERSPGDDASGSGCLCKPFPLVDPRDSSWLAYWDLCLTTLLAITAFATPFDAVYLPMAAVTSARAFRNLALDLFFILDMALQFSVVALDRKHRQVNNRREIAHEYLRGGDFWVDAASVLPSDLHLLAGLPPRVHRYVSLARLLRLTRLHRVTERWQQQLGITFAIISMVRCCSLLAVLCHWSACAWGYLAIVDDHNWLAALKTAKGGPDELYSGPISIYVLSLYWAVVSTTSIGYGDITPQNSSEYVVAMVSILLLGLFWAYVIGEVCAIMSNLQPHVIKYQHTMDSLNNLMYETEMPGGLRCRLREYFHRAQYVNRQRRQKAIISQMSPQLQGEVHFWINERWLSRVSYLSKCDRRAASFIARWITAQAFPPGELVSRRRTLFVMRHGLCARKGRVYNDGSVWGEDMLLFNSHLREDCTVNTLAHCDMIMLHASHVLAAAADYPTLRGPLMWARAKCGLSRAIVMIMQALRSLEPGELEAFRGLSASDRGRAYHAIVHAEFTPAWLDDCRRREQAKVKPFLEAEPTVDTAMQAINGLMAAVDQLTRSQARLAAQVADVSAKMMELSLSVRT